MSDAGSEERPAPVDEPSGDDTDEEHDEKQWPRGDRVVPEMGEREDGRLPHDRDDAPVPLLVEGLKEPTEQRLLLERGDGEPEEPPEQQVHRKAGRCVRRDGRGGGSADRSDRRECWEERGEGEGPAESDGEYEDDTGDVPEEVPTEGRRKIPPRNVRNSESVL